MMPSSTGCEQSTANLSVFRFASFFDFLIAWGGGGERGGGVSAVGGGKRVAREAHHVSSTWSLGTGQQVLSYRPFRILYRPVRLLGYSCCTALRYTILFRRRKRRWAILRPALSSGRRKRRLDSRQVNLLHHWREELTPARARALIEAVDVEEAAAMKAAAAKEAAAMKEQKI